MMRTAFAALFAAGLAVSTAHAATEAPFTEEAFAAAKQDGKPILVEISAPWCPICAKQKPILGTLLTAPAYKDLLVYQVDFDHQKDVVRELGATMQSTLIVYHGGSEKGRSTGETKPEAIGALVAKANS